MKTPPSISVITHSDCPLVSIIMPVRNGEKYIAEAIESCLQQTYQNIELLIVDDGSRDRTVEIIRSFGIEPIINQGRPGANAARNLGLKSARGVFVKFFDSDDILLAKAIERQVEFAKTLSVNEVGYGRLLQFGQYVSKYDAGFYQPDVAESNLDDLLCNGIQTALPLHRLEYLLSSGGFDESIQVGQEWNLHARMVLSGVRFKADVTKVLLYRAHADPARISVQHRSRPAFLVEKLHSLKVTFALRGTYCSLRSDEIYAAELFGLFTLAKESGNFKVVREVSEVLRSHRESFRKEWLSRRYVGLYRLLGHDLFFNLIKRFTFLEEKLVSERDYRMSFRNLFPARKI